jgi:hypothetical protein
MQRWKELVGLHKESQYSLVKFRVACKYFVSRIAMDSPMTSKVVELNVVPTFPAKSVKPTTSKLKAPFPMAGVTVKWKDGDAPSTTLTVPDTLAPPTDKCTATGKRTDSEEEKEAVTTWPVEAN